MCCGILGVWVGVVFGVTLQMAQDAIAPSGESPTLPVYNRIYRYAAPPRQCIIMLSQP
jgi:hypothetical protein